MEVDIQSLLGQFRVVPRPRKVELLGDRGLKPQDLAVLQMAGISSRPIMGPILDNLPLGNKAGKETLLLRLQKTDSRQNPRKVISCTSRTAKSRLLQGDRKAFSMVAKLLNNYSRTPATLESLFQRAR